MDNISPAPLLEEQLDITLRLLLAFSASMTVEELQTLRRRLAHTHHAIGQVVTLKILESEGVAPMGNNTHHPVIVD